MCDIVLEHPSCSRQHARLEHDVDGLFIQDLGSAQGSRVDGKALQPRARQALRHQSKCEFAMSSRCYVVSAPSFAKQSLSLDDKKQRLWSSKRKTDWSAAAAALGDESRSDKFLALMGAAKRTRHDGKSTNEAKAKQAQVFGDLAHVYDAAAERRRAGGRAGLG